MAASLLAGCGGTKGPSVTFRLAGPATPTMARCSAQSTRDGDALNAPVSKVRVSMRSHDASGAVVDFCDKVFDLGTQPPFLRLPAKDAATVDIFAEAFGPADPSDPATAGGFRRLATGSLSGIVPGATTLGPLRLYASDAFRCAGSQLGFPRAFHTATLLPDGRVLFIGGLVGNATDPTATTFPTMGATATGSAEIFDPRTQTVTPITEATTPIGRAFHAAQLLTTSGPCPSGNVAVLLVGGLTPSTAGGPMLVPNSGLGEGRLSPVPAFPATQLDPGVAPNEVLCVDPAAATGSRMKSSGSSAAYSASAATARGLVVSGGIFYDSTAIDAVTPTTQLDVYPADGTTPVTTLAGNGRLAATLTPIDASTGIVWGGGVFGGPVGEYVSGLDGTPSSTPIGLADAIATQFHTATPLTPTMGAPLSILVTGGFEIIAGAANRSPPSASRAVRLLSVVGGEVRESELGVGGTYAVDTTCSNQARYRPAGFESAAALSRGRVLVTGGSPSAAQVLNMSTPTLTVCEDCPGAASTLCSIGQASIYAGAGNQLVPAGGTLVAPRFGHTSTVLSDGAVLLAGGIGSEASTGDTPIFLTDLEVYDPRTIVPPYDSTKGFIDADDPLAAELTAANLARPPGLQAVDPAHSAHPAKSCSSF